MEQRVKSSERVVAPENQRVRPALDLSPNARVVLEKRYLRRGLDGKPIETPEEMFDRVARVVAEPEARYGGDPSVTRDKFYDLLTTLRFFPNSPTFTGAGTPLGQLAACFTPEMRVTTDAGVKPIAELEVGDHVLTHQGRYRPVLACSRRNYDGEILRIKVKLIGTTLRVTPEHPILTPSGWVPAGELQVGDLVALGVPQGVSFEIERIEGEDYTGLVYNCEVAEDHSYVVEGVAVHNCFVLPIADDMGRDPRGIFSTLRAAALIQQTGGGNGFSFSRLRPRGDRVSTSAGVATGPVGFLRVYDTAFGEVAQGGCLLPETLVFTADGLLRLDEIADSQQLGWQPHNLQVATDEGWRTSPRAFNNGVAPILRVHTRQGLSLAGTPEHRVKVMTREGLAWRALQDLRAGDWILVQLGQHRGRLRALVQPKREHGNQVFPRLPSILDEELAFFIGYLMGDGFVATQEGDHRVGVSVPHSSYLMVEMPALMERLFGVSVHRQQKPDDRSVTFVMDNRAVKEFLQKNGLSKPRSHLAQVPRLIRQSPPEIVGAFLRGLFEADGSISHSYPVLTTTSPRLAEEVATLLIGLGCPVRIRSVAPGVSHFGEKVVYHVRIESSVGLQAWRERIGCDPRSRFAACMAWESDLRRESTYVLPNARYWLEPALEAITLEQVDARGRGRGIKFYSATPRLRRALLRYLRGERQFTRSAYDALCQRFPEFAAHARSPKDKWFVQVLGVERVGEALTLDLEVEDNHTYLAYGMVTHNTRRGANMAVLRVDHPDIFDFVRCKEKEGVISNFNISVGITDAFMHAVENDENFDLVNPRDGKVWRTIRARELFNEIVKHAHHNGEPGVLFLDAANRANPVPHLYELEATNPCITGDTLVATPSGWRRADEIQVGDEICTVLGIGRVETVEVNYNVPVFDVYLSDGAVVRATAAHQFHVRDSRTKFFESRRVDQLRVGDWVRVYRSVVPDNPVPPTGAHLTDREYGFLVGVLVGDGCYTPRALSKNVVRVSTHADEEAWNQILQAAFTKVGAAGVYTYVNQGTRSMMMDPQPGKVIADWVKSLPLEPARGPDKRLPDVYVNSNRDFLTGLIDGLFSTDGSVDLQSNHPLLRFHTSSLELARQVRRILLMFGIYARISTTQRKRHDILGRFIRNDRPKYDVTISGDSLGRFVEQFRLSHPEKQMRLEEAALKANFTGGNWAARVVKIVPAGTATVYDLYEPRSDTWITEGFVSRGCGEQWLGPYENCCLGSINLAQHVTPDDRMDWAKLRDTVELSVRFLDNVVDANKYVPAIPELAEAAHRARRIGLGIMGLGDVMYRLGIRYGSRAGEDFAGQVMEFVRYHAMKTSIELARTRGAFPAIKGSIYDPENLKWTPPKPLEPFTYDWGRPKLDWGEIVIGIKKYGIRNAAQTTIAPTGCLVAGTLVVTDRGLMPIETLGDAKGERWQDINVTVASEGGTSIATQFYRNGRAHTLRVVTKRGYTLQGTDQHRIRIWKDGQSVWCRLDELKPGMVVILQATGLIGESRRVPLDTTFVSDFHTNPISLPSEMTPDLAYLIGFFMGDGSLKERTLRFSVSDRACQNRLIELIQRVFGIEPQISTDERSSHLKSVEVHSRNLVAFWQRNGFAKRAPTLYHRGKGYRPHIPLAVLATNDLRVYGAFLAGLFDADATTSGPSQLLTWMTTDQLFHDQVKSMLLALGILTTSDRHKTGWGQSVGYRLRAANADANLRLVARMPYLCRVLPDSRIEPRRNTLGDTIPLTRPQYTQLRALAKAGHEEQRVLGWGQRGCVSRASLSHFVEKHREVLQQEGWQHWIQVIEQDIFYDVIQSIEDGGWQETFDLSVPGPHAYVANGFISHNTIATVAGVESYGCEPVFALAYTRHVNDNGKDLQLEYVSPLFERALIQAGVDEATRQKIFARVRVTGTCQDIDLVPEKIRDTFVVASDITPEEHVRMQAALQAFVDNSISKTINFPETATVEDVERAYFLVWKLGCKGITVYRAGSREQVVLETKATAEKKSALGDTAFTKKPRPRAVRGSTYEIATPLGKAYITVNRNGEGEPFEVFCNVGKAGSDTSAVSEAIGRLISLALRLPSPMSPTERLKEIVDQLSGIGGGRSLGFGARRVRSLPDGIAQALAEDLGQVRTEPSESKQIPLFKIGDLCPECGQASFVNEEGCRKCYACGYSEC